MMTRILGGSVSVAFVGLAIWHFYMALTPGAFVSAAVPSVEGRPLFAPRRVPTIAVAVVLLLSAMLVSATAGLLVVRLPGWLLLLLTYALATGLLARAVGEFRYIGFFKRVRGSQFARLDTWLYSPLCLLLGIAVALIAWLSVPRQG